MGNSSESENSAVALLRSAIEEGVVVGFEGAQQVPKRDYTLAELKLNRIDASKLLSPVDNTVSTTRTALQVRICPDSSWNWGSSCGPDLTISNSWWSGTMSGLMFSRFKKVFSGKRAPNRVTQRSCCDFH